MSAPTWPGLTARGYWWELGADRYPPEHGSWVWVDLTHAPSDTEIEARRLVSMANYDERWAATLPFWRRRWAREAREQATRYRAQAAQLRSPRAPSSPGKS